MTAPRLHPPSDAKCTHAPSASLRAAWSPRRPVPSCKSYVALLAPCSALLKHPPPVFQRTLPRRTQTLTRTSLTDMATAHGQLRLAQLSQLALPTCPPCPPALPPLSLPPPPLPTLSLPPSAPPPLSAPSPPTMGPASRNSSTALLTPHSSATQMLLAAMYDTCSRTVTYN